MAKECMSCGKSMGALIGKVAVADGHVCTVCWGKAGMDMHSVSSGRRFNGATIRELMAQREIDQGTIDGFTPTRVVGPVKFDDESGIMLITKSRKVCNLYRYEQIIDFELLEDGETVTKGGLGRAIVGGVLFGAVGAVVGGVTGTRKTKGICKSLRIKITFRDSVRQDDYVDLIVNDTKTSGIIYKQAYQMAQDLMTSLQIIVDSSEDRSRCII